MPASPTALGANVFLLVLTALVKIAFTAWTFGMMVRVLQGEALRVLVLILHQVPAGIFLPTIAIGACLGRAVGLIVSVYPFATRPNLYADWWIGKGCTEHIHMRGYSRRVPQTSLYAVSPPVSMP